MTHLLFVKNQTRTGNFITEPKCAVKTTRMRIKKETRRPEIKKTEQAQERI